MTVESTEQLTERLRKMEDGLHLALCIIEHDAGLRSHEDGAKARLRWVAEIVKESGIDRGRVAKRGVDGLRIETIR